MIYPDAKLDQKFFDGGSDERPIRDGYGEGVVLAGETNPNVVVLCADLAESTRNEAFRKRFPERFFEMGVAEQNMATVAAGFGVTGKVPFIASYATFSPGRNWEQIRTTIAYNNSNVKIAGHHAGVSVGPDGATHQATEDIAIMRAMPNMRVVVPCDAIEARKATQAAAATWGPVYLRFQREETPIMTSEETPFTIGRAEIFWQAKRPDVLIVGCGAVVANALRAARALEKEKIGVVVVNSHTIKPLDERTITELAKKTGAVVTVEEHQVAGGLGGAVAEALARNHPVPMEFVGMQNTFGESGDPEGLIAKYGMDEAGIVRAVKKVLRKK
jgi:transketolase